VNQRAEYQGQRSLCLKVIVCTYTDTHTLDLLLYLDH